MRILLAVLVAIVNSSFAMPQTTPATAFVTGIVKRANSSETVPGAQVTLFGRDDGQTAARTPVVTATDGNGRFTFRNLPPGIFTLRAQAEGYVGAAGASRGEVAFNIVANQQSQDVTMNLIPLSSLSGTLLDPNGSPLNGVKVSALRLEYSEGRETLKSVKTVITDDRGAYRLFGLAPGDYFLRAEPLPLDPARQSSPDDGTRTYYPGTIEPTPSGVIPAEAGLDQTGRNFKLQSTAKYKVSGRVVNQFQNPQILPISGTQYVEVSEFVLVPLGMALEEDIPAAIGKRSGSGGEFEILGVRPGRYELYAIVRDQGADRRFTYYFDRTPIEVMDKDVEGVALSIRPGVELKVRVSLASGITQTLTAPGLIPRGYTPEVLAQTERGPFPVSAGSATATFQNVASGTYDIEFGVPGNHYIADIRQNGQSVLDSGVTITEENPGLVEVVLLSGGGTITGVVQDKQWQPVSNTPVVLVPQAPHRTARTLYRTVTTNRDGTYTLRNVRPGEYKVFAWEVPATTLGTEEYLNSHFLAQYESDGKLISVSEAATTNTPLELISRKGSPVLSGPNITSVAVPSSPRAASQPSLDPGGAGISGRVTAAGTTNPIAGVQIMLTLRPESGIQDAFPDRTAISTGDGHFEFKGLPPGRFVVSATHEGFFGPITPLNAAATGVSKEIVVAREQQLQDIAIELFAGGTISGRILNLAGRPMTNVSILPLRLTYSAGQRKLTPVATSPSRTITTDDRGVYRISGLAPGQYYITATPPPYRTPSGTADASADTYSKTYFPGVTDARTAVPVVLAPGSEEIANFNLPSTRLFKISGKVIGLGGGPVRVTQFELVPQGTEILEAGARPRLANLANVRSSEPGQFELQGIEPGVYDLYPYILDEITRTYSSGRTTVTVTNKDVEGVTAILRPGSDVRVRVILDGDDGRPPQISLSRVRWQSRDTLPTFLSTTRSSAGSADADGAFTYKGFPEGRYNLLASVGSASYIADIRVGGTSVYRNGLLVSGSGPGLVDVILKSDGGAMDGVVTDAEGKPVEGVAVALVPEVEWRGNSISYRSTTTGLHGIFSLQAIAPGKYKLFAWSVVEPGAWENAEFISKYEEAGQVVSVAPNSQLDVRLNLIPAK